MNVFATITRPTLILDEIKARKNLEAISTKIEKQNILFRPHFKTHQSAEIGEWFHKKGIQAITVSSVEMAVYFSNHAWQDILIAFPVNLREVESIDNLAKTISLTLLVESMETANFLEKFLSVPVKIRVKVDVGSMRSGIDWNDPDKILRLVEQLNGSKKLKFDGLLTHAGHSYRAHALEEVASLYEVSLQRMQFIQKALINKGFHKTLISVGDTPTTSLVEDFGAIDEIRPGNFLFYDVQQYKIGSCSLEEIAVCVACPIVAIHEERDEVVIYGGAIHFSKDFYQRSDGSNGYGIVVTCISESWNCRDIIGELMSLSQEHGVIKCLPGKVVSLEVGDLVCVLPAHSCLTVQAMQTYKTLDGKIIQTLNSFA